MGWSKWRQQDLAFLYKYSKGFAMSDQIRLDRGDELRETI